MLEVKIEYYPESQAVNIVTPPGMPAAMFLGILEQAKATMLKQDFAKMVDEKIKKGPGLWRPGMN